MKYAILGVAALLAAPAAAQGPAPAWGYFEAGTVAGVGVQAADGSQLMLKCDKPGANSVYAVIARKAPLVPPAQNPVMRDVQVRYDAKSPYDDHWRVFENTAMAVNKGNERSLTHLLGDINAAETLEVLLYNDLKSRAPLTMKFNVAGAKAALDQVYTKCKDTMPAG